MLVGNSINDEPGFLEIADYISECATIKELVVDNNNISNSYQQFIDMLEENTSLEYVNMGERWFKKFADKIIQDERCKLFMREHMLKHKYGVRYNLQLICKKGNLNDVKSLIETLDDYNVNNTDDDGKTGLYYAAYHQHDNIVQYLLSKGGQQNDVDNGKSRKKKEEEIMELKNKYKKEFPKGTPIVCACEKGRFEDVKLLITGRKNVNGSNGNNNNMTLKEYVNQVGKESDGNSGWTPLMIAAKNEHVQIVQYLIEQGKADANIANSDGGNALHYAAWKNKKNTELIDFLLTHMSLNSINKKSGYGETPLDLAYIYNNSPIQQKIIDLIRSKGGKRS